MNEEAATRGLTLILDQAAFGPLNVGFMANCGDGGSVVPMKKWLCFEGADELVAPGWLAEPVEGDGTLVYEHIGDQSA